MLAATGQKFESDTNVIPKAADVLHGGAPWYVLLREKQMKYVRPLVTGLEELYDLRRDPDELDNLAVKADQSGICGPHARCAGSDSSRGVRGASSLPPLLGNYQRTLRPTRI